VQQTDAAREHLLMALRLAEGLDLDKYRARWNQVFDQTVLADLKQDGYLARCGARIFATPSGRLVLNTVLATLADAIRPATKPAPEMILEQG
jgi:oxygen-independent coproporphyrinogen-3 oxidase